MTNRRMLLAFLLISTFSFAGGTYKTSFPATETPISEGGNWVNGAQTGLAWKNVNTTPGYAFGTQVGNESCPPNCNDSTAILTGTWGVTQYARAVVKVTGTSCVSANFSEVELRLHSTVTANVNNGYEFNFRCAPGSGSAYAQIVRWNGALGNFTYLANQNTFGAQYAVGDGFVVEATAVPNGSGGLVLTSYINGTKVAEATDSTFLGGSPGVGFFFSGSTGNAAGFGFSSFTASDSLTWINVLAPDHGIDWSLAGAGTIPPRTTICQTLGTAGQLPTFVQSVTAAQISSAITTCNGTGNTVMLNAGTYNLSASVTWPTTANNVTLRGAGASQTILHWTAINAQCQGLGPYSMCIWNGDTSAWSGGQPNLANWTAGYAPGTTSITFGSMAAGSISGLHVGSLLHLMQQDNADPGANLWMCQTSGSNGSCSQQGASGTAVANHGQTQTVVVTSITGSGPWTVGISPGVMAPNIVSGRTPQAFWSTSAPVNSVGIENMTLDNSALNAGAYGGIISFWEARNSWVSGVRSINSNTTNGSAHKHVWVFQSSHITVRDSYFYGSSPSSEGYGVNFAIFTSDSLSENNICQHLAACMIEESAGGGNVFGYNYAVDAFYNGAGTAPDWQGSDSNHHQVGDIYSLWEGHEGIMFRGDNIHGSSFFNTVFRSYFNGRDPTLSGGAPKSSNTSAVVIESSNHFYHLIGNVLGTQAYHTHYEYKPPNTTDCGSSSTAFSTVMWFGYSDDNGINYSPGCFGSSFTIPNDLSVATTLMRWGNYAACTGDANCNAVRFVAGEVPSGNANWPNPVPASQALPASFYLSAKPSWWTNSLPWPPVGPDVDTTSLANSLKIANVGNHVALNPAANMYLNVMGGKTDGSSGALTFDASLYNSGSGPAVQLSPTLLPFPSTFAYTSSATQPITMSNIGLGTLTITSITITGANPTEYSQTNDCGSSLGAGLSCTITVTFSPLALGIRTATVSVSDNASGSPHMASLTGTGTDPFIYRPSVVSDTGTSAFSNPTFAYDANFSTGAIGFANHVNPTQTTINITYGGFPANVGSGRGTLVLATNANVGVPSNDGKVEYSLDSGSTWSLVYDLVNPSYHLGPGLDESVPVFDLVSLPPGQDFTRLRVRGSATTCNPLVCGVKINFFEVYVQTNLQTSQTQGTFVGTIQ